MVRSEVEERRGIDRVGASRWRGSYLHWIGAGVAFMAAGLFAARKLGLHEPGYPDVLVATCFLGAVVLWGRHRTLVGRSSNEDGLRVFDLLLCAVSFTVLVFVVCWWGDVPYPLGLALVMLVVGATVGVLVVYVDSRLWWTAVTFVLAAVAIMAVPEYRGLWIAIASGILVARDLSSVQRAALRTEVLARAREALSASLDYETTLATVARLPVPRFADWCAVDVLEDGVLRRKAVAHVDPSKAHLVEESGPRRAEGSGASRNPLEILQTGKAELISQLPAAPIEGSGGDEAELRALRALRSRSYIGVPLIMRSGEAFGVLSLGMAESGRVYGSTDLDFATTLAGLAAVTVENARVYREAERARAEAELANHAKDDFLAMLGHELRNPLAPIMTALEVMKQQPEDSSAVERARSVIERQAGAMVRLVEDLLDVSRIAHGRIGLQRERVRLADLVTKALEAAMPSIERRKHRIDVAVDPASIVDADPLRMVQVIVNVLNNAAKYTESGGRIVIRGETEGGDVVLRVQDDGTGISPDMIPKVFEVFVQQPQGIERAQGGLGLGLAIVKSLVELHGGRVAVHSEGLGRGSEVVVRLPSAAGSPRPENAREPRLGTPSSTLAPRATEP